MATVDKKYYHNIDLDSNELKAGRIYNLTTVQRSALSLTTTDKGYVVYDTTLLSLYIWNGTTWTTVAGGVSSLSATGPITVSASTGAVSISTSMATNKLIGRSSANTGVMEEITVGTGLTLSSGTLSATATGVPHATALGTDTYTATIPGVTSYNDGDAYIIQFTNGNTTTCTLNINGLGAIPLYRNNDSILIGGDIQANGEMLCVYDATVLAFRVIGTSPNSLISYVTNDDSVTLTKGMPVYAFSGTGDRMTVKRANNTSDSTSAQTVGLVMSNSIGVNQKGFIMMQGLLDGLSILPTSTWSDGNPVYLGSTAGSITPNKPYAPNHLVYLGFVTTASNGSAGRMYVRVQNGYELDELHNVQAQNPTLKDTLYYDNTVSPAQWKTASISTILGYTPQSSLTSLNGILYANGSNVTALQKISSNIQLLGWTTGLGYSFIDYISLPLFNTTDKGLVPAATSGSSTDLFLTSAGTWAKINLSGIANQLSKTILANTTGSTGAVSAVSISSITTDLSTVVGDTGSGGTKGIVPAPSAGDAAAGKFLKADGTWTTPSNQTITLTGDVTGSGTSSFSTTIANSVVSLAKMSNLAANSIIGNNTGSSATPLALTGTQVTAMLDNFTSTLKGLVPLSGGGTTNFLRADGTWAAPSGGGGTPSGSSTYIQYNSSGSFGASANFVYDFVNNRVGVGTTTPLETVDIVVSSANALRAYRAADTSGSTSMIFHKSRGTASSPTAVQNADGIGVFNFGGYDGSAFINTAYFGGVCEATPSTNTVPIGIRFVTGTTVANRTERLRIDSLGNIGIGQSTPTHKVEVVAGTLTDGQNALRLTATMPTTITANNYAVDFQITSAGLSSFSGVAMNINYLAGYTGGTTTRGLRVINSAAGTAANIAGQASNYGILGSCDGTTTGYNVGVHGNAQSGNISVGVVGRSTTAKNSATNIGVAAFATNTGTSPIQIAGYFGLQSSDPTFTSAALMADNGSTTDPIFVARDNGTVVVQLSDGGFFGIGNGSTAATSQLQVNKNQNSVTQADANGILLANSTAAIAGTQSISPPIVWQGNGWSTGSSASQDVRFRADVLPTQSSNANATWRLSYSLNGAAYSNAFTVDTVGAINFALAASFSSSVTVSGVLIQSNFRASTNNAYQSTQFLVGLADTATQSYRTTNAGSDVNTRLLCVYNNSNSSSGTLGIVADAVNGLMFTAANGTRMIARAAITIGNLTNTAGSEAGDLLFHSQSGGTAYSQKMRISGLGNVVLGAESALSTSATDGFAYMPSGSGAPSGTPTSYTGKKAFYYDATNDRIYIYNGAWKMIQLI